MSVGDETDASCLSDQLVAEFRGSGHASSAFASDLLAEQVATCVSHDLAAGVLVTRIGSKVSISTEV